MNMQTMELKAKVYKSTQCLFQTVVQRVHAKMDFRQALVKKKMGEVGGRHWPLFLADRTCKIIDFLN